MKVENTGSTSFVLHRLDGELGGLVIASSSFRVVALVNNSCSSLFKWMVDNLMS